MDRETKKYLNRARGVSSDGVPNRKGGSWPNHPSMRYELPIPFSPGADNVTEAYRLNFDETFDTDGKFANRFCPRCDKSRSWCECTAEPAPEPCPSVKPPRPRCTACGNEGEHRIAPGILSCES